ncbi:S ribonuclease [Pyrus ussuriensis x Pyrus communis]|uniref:S ribonuclease n=1 Tax=Pyrus ussuriensis x Pyrus communis TaxID=2448454 RepID=A0A5N5I8A4_9ROSA|nr:S ribonuclease [Pyrus ussuriensis x Pyrus communis]
MWNGMLQHVQTGGRKTLSYLRKKRTKIAMKVAIYRQQVTKAYNSIIKPRNFKERDLVLKIAKHIRKQIFGPSKFALHWEGPFVIKEAYQSGYYYLTSVKEGTLTKPVNAKLLKPYYC